MTNGEMRAVVGGTPLIRLKSLSEWTGCEIWGKAEFLNPGGSVKDRAAKGILQEAEHDGRLRPGMRIFEGTAGNTGIGLAVLAAQSGYRCTIVMPDNQAAEKYQTLEALGVDLVKVKPVPFADPNHFYHTARRVAEGDPQGFWANQFENTANARIHEATTGPEIWEQTQGRVKVFCAATGTGGTLAGVSRFLKSKNPGARIVLVDPEGSGLHEWFHRGEIKAQGTSITEGIGIMRLTENFKLARIDESRRVNDHAMIDMLYHLAKYEGLLVGTSAALNVRAAYELALERKGSGDVIVTILCDGALRYASKVFNPAWLAEKGLAPKPLVQP